MIKVTKGKPPIAANQNRPDAPAIAGTGATPAHFKALAKAFAPVVEHRAVVDLKDNPRNARIHSDRQVQQIAASMTEFGWLAPIVVDEDGTVLAGHGRLRAARLLNMTDVPTILVEHLTPARKRAFMLADNKISSLSSWSQDLLTIELKELSGPDLDFDFEVTGFDTRDVDLLDAPVIAKPAVIEAVPELERNLPAVSAVGDLWKLGSHLLYCGSALEEDSYTKLLDAQRAQMVFTDPPYNVKIDGHVCGLGSVHHRDFEMAAGEMSDPQFTQFLATAMGLMGGYSVDGAIHYVCMDWRHMGEVMAAGKGVYSEQKNLCVWNKTNGGMGAFYRSKHELVLVFKVGTASHINNFGLGAGGRYRTNVWDYAGVNTFKRGRMDELSLHPTVKPLPMVVDALKDCSTRRGIVLDPFCGSGTTLLAAEKTGRLGRGIELDPHYVDATIGRWQALTGKHAIHAGSGLCFDEVASASPAKKLAA